MRLLLFVLSLSWANTAAAAPSVVFSVECTAPSTSDTEAEVSCLSGKVAQELRECGIAKLRNLCTRYGATECGYKDAGSSHSRLADEVSCSWQAEGILTGKKGIAAFQRSLIDRAMSLPDLVVEATRDRSSVPIVARVAAVRRDYRRKELGFRMPGGAIERLDLKAYLAGQVPPSATVEFSILRGKDSWWTYEFTRDELIRGRTGELVLSADQISWLRSIGDYLAGRN
jgi:hypothetical protein